MKALFTAGMVFLISTIALATPVTITALDCSGLGMAGGYTTLKLTGPGTVAMRSTKYGQVFTDNNVKIMSTQISPVGQLKVNFLAPGFGTEFSLVVVPNSVGPAYLVTSGGTDILTCQSRMNFSVR